MKKTAVSKTKKTSASKPGQRVILEKELKSLIKKSDEEGLIFLIRQAQTIVHNLQVDRLNQTLQDIAPSKGRKQKNQHVADSAGKTSVDIEEASGGKHFIMVLNGQRKMFTREELRKVVKLAHAGANNTDGGGKIYLWLKNNRQDVLLDAGIASKQHPVLAKLSGFLKKRYKVKK